LAFLALLAMCLFGPSTWGATLSMAIDPTIQQIKKLTASDAAEEDEYGRSAAISGDTAVVGSPYDNLGAGSMYVYSRNEGGANNWGEVKKVIASDSTSFDDFGWSVAISQNTAVVGAYLADDGAVGDAGSAYVFERDQGEADNWGEIKKLTASDAAENDVFGWSVAIAGDSAAIGAPGDDDAGSSAGSAYVFNRDQDGGDNWGEVEKLTAGDGAANDIFGTSVAVAGDTTVVGAPTHDHGAGFASGSAYVYERNEGGPDAWGQVKELLAFDGAGGDQFGHAVAIDGDTVIVGAPFGDDAGESSGSAYVLGRDQGGTGNWGLIKKLTVSDAVSIDQFGFSVAIDGDTAAVGARGDDGSAGSVHVFKRHQGGTNNWGEIAKLTADDGAIEDELGFAVGISGDMLVAGAHLDDDDGDSSGSAYLFRGGFPHGAVPIAPSGTSADTTPMYSWRAVTADSAGDAFAGSSASVFQDAATWYYLWVDGPSGNIMKQWYTAAATCGASGVCSVTPPTVLELGAHTWWVRTWNATGYGPWSPAVSFTVSGGSGLPGIPVLASPAGAIDVITPSYVWYAVPSDATPGAPAGDAATWYYLWINGPSGNVYKKWHTAASVCSGATCAITPTLPLAEGAHTWWVQSYNALGSGPWSVARQFTAPAAGRVPAQPVLTTPEASITDTTPTYVWDRVEGSTWYYLWVDGPSGTRIQQWYTAAAVCAGHVCSATPTTELVSGVHRWWVRSWNDTGNGPWSASKDFSVQ
jgi:hypothetical protein